MQQIALELLAYVFRTPLRSIWELPAHIPDVGEIADELVESGHLDFAAGSWSLTIRGSQALARPRHRTGSHPVLLSRSPYWHRSRDRTTLPGCVNRD